MYLWSIFFLPKEVFDSYQCDKKTKIGVNIGNLNKLLKRVGGSEELTMKLGEKENKLQLKFKGKANRTFSLNLIDIEEEEYPSPKIQFNATITLSEPSLLSDAIKDAELFSDHVKLEVDSDKFMVFAAGDNGDASVEIPKEREAISLEVKENSRSMYPISYLTNIIKIGNVTETLTLEFSSEMPMLMSFKLKPINDSYGYISYFLAPRVEEEEEEEVEEEEKPGKAEVELEGEEEEIEEE